MLKQVVSQRWIIFVLSIAMSLMLALSIFACNSGNSVDSGKSASKKYPGDPASCTTPGIQNCHGYVWWMLTGVPSNSKRVTDLEKELERRGYRAYSYGSDMLLRPGDVLVFKNGIDHSGIVITDGKLSHYRITEMQEVVQDTSNLPSSIRVGSLLKSGDGTITDPAKLYSYPEDYEKWLIAQNTEPDIQNVTREAIQEKKREGSWGFFHEADTMNEVKALLYPSKDPAIIIWKLPIGIEITPGNTKISQDEEQQLEVWFLFGPGIDKVRASSHSNVRVYWDGPGEIELIGDGLLKGNDMKIGQNDVKVSAEIVTPWGLASDSIKPKYVGKDVYKWLEAIASITVESASISTGELDVLKNIQQTTYLLVRVMGDSTYHVSDGSSGFHERLSLTIYSGQPETIWKGTHFTHNYYLPPSATTSGIAVIIEGEVTEKADKIINLSAKVIYLDSHLKPPQERELRISIQNINLELKSPIPLKDDPNYEPQFTGYVTGREVANHVTDTFYEHRAPVPSDPNFKTWYDPLIFTNEANNPHLLIVFKTRPLDSGDYPNN